MGRLFLQSFNASTHQQGAPKKEHEPQIWVVSHIITNITSTVPMEWQDKATSLTYTAPSSQLTNPFVTQSRNDMQSMISLRPAGIFHYIKENIKENMSYTETH